MSLVVRIARQVDSVDCERLEAKNLNGEGVDSRGKFAKLVDPVVAGASFEDRLGYLVGDQNSCILNNFSVDKTMIIKAIQTRYNLFESYLDIEMSYIVGVEEAGDDR